MTFSECQKNGYKNRHGYKNRCYKNRHGLYLVFCIVAPSSVLFVSPLAVHEGPVFIKERKTVVTGES